MNVLLDMMAFIVRQKFVIVFVGAMHRGMHWTVRWYRHVDRNYRVSHWVFVVLFMAKMVEDFALFFFQMSCFIPEPGPFVWGGRHM